MRLNLVTSSNIVCCTNSGFGIQCIQISMHTDVYYISSALYRVYMYAYMKCTGWRLEQLKQAAHANFAPSAKLCMPSVAVEHRTGTQQNLGAAWTAL